MKSIEETVKTLEGYLYLLQRNPEEGYYEIQIGVPPKWKFKSNKFIECDVLKESDKGKLISIYPKKKSVTIDDLFGFAIKIVEVNLKALEIEQQLKEKIKNFKEQLIEEQKTANEEMEDYLDSAFEEDDKEEEEEKNEKGKKRRPGRPRKNKNVDDDGDILEELTKDSEEKEREDEIMKHIS